MARTIIALIGPKGCGKSTLASLLNRHYGFVAVPFAGPLKSMLDRLLAFQGVDYRTIHQMLYGDLKEEPTPYLDGRTPRHAMQTLGTEWRDLISRTLWTSIWQRQMEAAGNGSFVVDDMRFSHEAEAVRKFGGHIFRIYREDQEPSADTHQSEQEYLPIDHDGSIINYPNVPERMLRQLLNFLPQLGADR